MHFDHKLFILDFHAHKYSHFQSCGLRKVRKSNVPIKIKQENNGKREK